MDSGLTLSSIVAQRSGLLTQSIDDDLVILHPETGEYYGSVSSGRLIWQLIEQPVSIASLIDQLVAEVEGERAVIEADVLEYLADMLEEDLIEVHDD